MKSLSSILLMLCCLGVASLSAQNNVLTVQGILKKTDGSAVPDDVYNLRFSLYDAEIGGNQVWTEVINDVETIGGVYSVLLGTTSAAPLNASFNVPYYLGVKIGSSSQELLPRPRLTTAPYSMSLNGATNKIPSSGASTLETLTMNGTLKINNMKPITYGFGVLLKNTFPYVSEIGGFADNFSVEAAGYIQSFGVFVTSDRRTKKDFSLSSPKKDLELLQQLQVTNYKYKDVYGKGDVWKKGVIAQEVAQVVPEAVSLGTNVIPDIYAVAQNTRLDAGVLKLDMPQAHGLKVGDKVRLMAGNVQEDLLVSATLSATEFAVSNWNHAAPEKVFVYGREVNDFQAVDYDQLFTLNISATQELTRRLEALEKENAAYKSANSEMRELLENLRADVEALKAQR